jgi:hypothetical protein
MAADGSTSAGADEQVRVVFLRGDARARGRALGEALAERREEAREQLSWWVSFLPRLMRSRMPHLPRAAWDNAARLAGATMVKPVERGLSPKLRGALVGLAEGFGPVDLGPYAVGDTEDVVLHTHAMYDAVNMLAGLPLYRPAPASRLGCSSLITLPSTTASGELIHGRNFDLNPAADEYAPLLCVHAPSDGLAHVSLHHGGAFTAGITATNIAGLTLGVHQTYTRRVSPRAGSVIDTALEVIESCSSLTAAIELLQRRPTAGGWIFVLSDARAGRAAAVEMDAAGAAVLHPPGDFLAVSNVYRTRKDRDSLAPTGAVREFNWSRLSRLNALARQDRGAHDPTTIASALGDQQDAYAPAGTARRRPFGNVVSQLNALDSVVISPGLDVLYVATGDAPRNTAGRWLGFSLSSLFAGRVEELETIEAVQPDDEMRAARRHAARAAQVLWDDDDRERALDELEDASRLLPDEPGFALLRGAMLLAEGFALDAIELCGDAVELESSPYRRGSLALLLGRAYDVLGHRRDARQWYDRVPELAGDVDDVLLARAAANRARGFDGARARALILDPVLCDLPA